jgi:hypothetical protein
MLLDGAKLMVTVPVVEQPPVTVLGENVNEETVWEKAHAAVRSSKPIRRTLTRLRLQTMFIHLKTERYPCRKFVWREMFLRKIS